MGSSVNFMNFTLFQTNQPRQETPGTRVLLLCVLFLLPFTGNATEYQQERALQLTLRDAIHRALNQNLGLQIDRLDPQIAAEGGTPRTGGI